MYLATNTYCTYISNNIYYSVRPRAYCS